jgi:acetyl esterase/lipase
MAETPSFLRPFVLSPPACEPERTGAVDLYVPAGNGPFPAVLIVHGGPMPPQVVPKPRDWPVYQGYAAELAAHGILAAVVEHRLHVVPGPDGAVFDYVTAAADVAAAIEALRSDKRADADRVLLWFFSGGSLLSGDWLHDAPAWLRGVALSYPVLTPLPGGFTDPHFGPVGDVLGAGFPPILLTRAGLEDPAYAEGVAEFLAAAARAGVPVEVIDVPNGRHSFDVLDHTDESRTAVRRAITWVGEQLGQPV